MLFTAATLSSLHSNQIAGYLLFPSICLLKTPTSEGSGPGLGWKSRELRKQVLEGKESGKEEVPPDEEDDRQIGS